MRIQTIITVLFLLSVTTLSAQDAKTIKRDSFSLQYPSNWTIDTKDEDYDPDALFSIDAPDENSMIMFMIFTTPLDAEELVAAQVDAFSSELLKNPEISSITSWGNYKGTGKILRGKIMGVFKGFVKIFVYGDEHKTMLVVEQCYDKIYDQLKKGYELIASSFKFH
jgi:hypothetical protein